MATMGDPLEQAAEQAQDLLLVYYAGHGLIDRRGELHLALSTTRGDRIRWTAVPFSYLRQVVADSAASNRVLILDCCFSGRAIEAMADPRSVISGQIEITGTYTLTATSANTPAHAPSGARYTAFTGALLDLLRVGMPEGPELLTLDVIYLQLLRNLAANGSPRPERLGTLTTGFLALGRNRAAMVSDFQPEADHDGGSEALSAVVEANSADGDSEALLAVVGANRAAENIVAPPVQRRSQRPREGAWDWATKWGPEATSAILWASGIP